MSGLKIDTLIVQENTVRSFVDGLALTAAQTNKGDFVEMTFFSFTSKAKGESKLSDSVTISAKAEFIARTDMETLKAIRNQIDGIIDDRSNESK
ncbi:hypothetical protein [Edwardsiella tarda]|uniref:hypothetical protein n=1 Tax=Edwardsiella tarda TaxID=636 RepID=UPI00054E976E|nr:hypothetical protein [Edwardsiella tarda]